MILDPAPDADTPHVFATPLGVDLCAALIEGLGARLHGQPPEAWARVEIFVANARMQRRLQTLFMARGPGLMPRIRPVQALGATGDLLGVPRAVSPLRLRLQLADLIGRLLDRFPDLAPRSALYDLSDSLADLIGEMCEEGVTPGRIAALNVGDHSQHWQRAQAFLGLVSEFLDDDMFLPAEARQARVVDHLIRRWRDRPPEHPIIVAGSTGSRGPTARLMAAVAQLPQGAVILPGLDADMRPDIWARLLEQRRTGLGGEDHPQYRFARFAAEMGLAPGDIPPWTTDKVHNPNRSKALSLALRPAPVTDQWREEGPALDDLEGAFADVTLLEAPSPQIEAAAIALRLRQAVETGQSAALITPDRQLARQVTAALDRWGVLPDDSAGRPLSQTAPGRFLRHVADLMTGPVEAEGLVVLLKHPICHSSGERGPHLKRSRDLELQVLRRGNAIPPREQLIEWATKRADDPGAIAWVTWLWDSILSPARRPVLPLAERVAQHISLAEALARGSEAPDGTGKLYLEEPGLAVARLVAELRGEAAAGGDMSALDYRDLFTALTEDREVRPTLRPHADVLIWGTQEARVQGADLMILAGLNEGTWPSAPSADPWLNRQMRSEAGLRLPDRVIGLSAHDFQQAMAAREVWITRAVRDAETDTVPSRWLNRLINLLNGATPASKTVLQQMRKRGATYLSWAEALSAPAAGHGVRPAPRPAPCPPVTARPDRLSVTDIEKLIRDPYHIYAKRVLNLRPLDPLRAQPDAALRGSVLHAVLHEFIAETQAEFPPAPAAEEKLMACVDRVLAQAAPWPAARRLWRVRMARVAGHIIETEIARRVRGQPRALEVKGEWAVPGTGVTLQGTADRIDRLHDGSYAIFDYKTGQPPEEKVEKAFNKQLWLEALMAQGGAFALEAPVTVRHMAYLGLGTPPKTRPHDPTPEDLAQMQAQFIERLHHMRAPATGFVSRRAMQKVIYGGDYDHLARYGEWDETHDAVHLVVGGHTNE